MRKSENRWSPGKTMQGIETTLSSQRVACLRHKPWFQSQIPVKLMIVFFQKSVRKVYIGSLDKV